MKATMLDFRKQPRKILRALMAHEPVTLYYRGKVAGVIEPVGAGKATGRTKDHPSFGLWKNRADLADPLEFVRRVRAPRYRAL